MELDLQTVILECGDLPSLVEFYQGLLRWPVVYESETFVRLRSPKSGVELGVQYDPDYRPPVWPTQPGQQQMMAHLDLSVQSRAELQEAARLAVSLGAALTEAQYGGDWITLTDPAGHPFCFVYWG